MNEGATVRVLAEVATERERQGVRWGEQNHVDGTGSGVRIGWRADTYGAAARVCRSRCQDNGAPERPDNWADILLEEVYEALAEDDPTRLRNELIQVAAVAAQWVEAIDRRTGGPA